jgi:hypothetical protein
MDKIDNGVNYYIDRYAKEQRICVLSVEYQSLEGEQKKQCYETIKALLIELYGVVALSNI